VIWVESGWCACGWIEGDLCPVSAPMGTGGSGSVRGWSPQPYRVDDEEFAVLLMIAGL
jgi:hypothetical protein